MTMVAVGEGGMDFGSGTGGYVNFKQKLARDSPFCGLRGEFRKKSGRPGRTGQPPGRGQTG